ncbi:MAG: NUDIX hydrolase [Coriobacteriia bacterium]|nr:NUDIX hydrolase [Coriobacteriia bacterium]
MKYTYDYPRPAFCCDTVVCCGSGDARKVLLVRRGSDPCSGSWALPGGFVDEGEKPTEAAQRELAEETGLTWEGPFASVGTFADPGRDSRGWTVSAAYLVDIGEKELETAPDDDAVEARWFLVSELPTALAFDHDRIITEALQRISHIGTDTRSTVGPCQ